MWVLSEVYQYVSSGDIYYFGISKHDKSLFVRIGSSQIELPGYLRKLISKC